MANKYSVLMSVYKNDDPDFLKIALDSIYDKQTRRPDDEVICSALGKKAHIWNIPRGLMNGIAKLGDVFHLPLNSMRMQKLTENYVVSNAKIKAALGMKEMPVRAKDGLKETIKSFAKN